MNLRQKLQVILMIVLTLLSFGAYHEGTGSVVWLQWLSVLSIMAFLLIFDLGFTNEHSFIFDPDAENWRRKVVRFTDFFNYYSCCTAGHFWYTFSNLYSVRIEIMHCRRPWKTKLRTIFVGKA